MSQPWFAPLFGIAVALSCGCAVDSIESASFAAVCQEAVARDSQGDPRNAAGDIRYCWPTEPLCFCDQDNDCYALEGYVPCTPPSDAGADAATDVPRDVAMDLGVDARVDAGACPPESTTPDSQGRPRNAAGVIRYCWPGEARCFCDSDNDCYAEAGYVPCSRSTDAGVDVPQDAVSDTGATDVPATDGSESTGRWSASQPWPFPAVHSALLPDGRVLFWSDDHDLTPRIWNPATNAFTDTGFTRSELHCAGHSFLADGRLFLTGGEPTGMHGTGAGITDTNLFDYTSSSFSVGPTMRDLRWYPTNTTLPNGEVLVTGGTRSYPGDSNPIPEVYSLAGTLRPLTTAYRLLEPYPLMFVAPNGLVFQAGPDHDTQYLEPVGNGRWIPLTSMNATARIGGSAVMYDDGRVLILGGSSSENAAPVATAEVINLNAATPRWTNTASMARPRRDPNSTLLPDGTVLVVGGTASIGGAYVLDTELWSPVTGSFTRLAPVSVGRAYHSTSLLLPDGRVLFAGGNDFVAHPNAQIFSPPYLFRGPRPTITSAPSSVAYGASFTVATPDAATVTGASWIRLGATTHGFDQNQRINRLSFTRATDGLAITAPSDARLCPPGHYLLFLLSDRGVPSIARVIRIR